MGIQKCIQHHHETISQVQKVGVVTGQMIRFLQAINGLQLEDTCID